MTDALERALRQAKVSERRRHRAPARAAAPTLRMTTSSLHCSHLGPWPEVNFVEPSRDILRHRQICVLAGRHAYERR